MIVYELSSGSRTIGLGPFGEEHCSNCNAQREFDLYFCYDYVCFQVAVSAYEEPAEGMGYLTDRAHYKHCRQSGMGVRIKPYEVDQERRHVPIPFSLRYGCLLCILSIAGLLVFVAVVVKYAPRQRVLPNVQSPSTTPE